MGSRTSVDRLIERIVADSRIPGRRERDDLRRELRAHFEDARARCASEEEAIARFGEAHAVSDGFRVVYRAQYVSWYAAKVAGALLASLAAALVIEFLVSSPHAFRYMASMGCAVAVGFGVARESVVRWFGRPRKTTIAPRWIVGFGAIAAWEYIVHNAGGIHFGVGRAAGAGAILIAVAGATALIMALADRAFARLFETA